METLAEENYLKAVFKLSKGEKSAVSTGAIAEELKINAASVTDKLKRLSGKKLLHYEKSRGAFLTETGRKVAVSIIRKHRIWELFLVQKLGFKWDEVHEIAEQLEHVQSDKLIDKIDAMLGFPKTDPHGDPIPDKNGNFEQEQTFFLSSLKAGKKYKFKGVTDHSPEFLKHLEKLGLIIGDSIQIKEVEEFDKTMQVILKGNKKAAITHRVASNILVSE